ncbi:MAG: accessory gene regulator B family protein [Peptococcaceae bacterium]|nr:accessory gene regulator B family protein [Peptococcaceae bacterium]
MMQAAERLSSLLVTKSYIKAEEHHVYSYCFEIIFSSIAFWGSMLLLAVLTNNLLPTVAYLASFLLFRHTAGGYHASTHFRCFMMSVVCYLIFFLAITFIPSHLYPLLSFVFIGISYAVFLTLAPIDHPNNPFTPEVREKLRKKLLSLILFFLLSIAILCFHNCYSLVFYLTCGCLQSGTAILLAEKARRKEGGYHG